ncbi:MAG: hypothetical protein M3270_04415, partial [Thermoproteota archaeon]|nr:hypothetical protein [Thermoproteota archaeon]
RRITLGAMQSVYVNYKKRYFSRLLEDPLVPEEDKRKLRDLLKKPWNLYIRRHTAATEISKKLKDSVLLDQYMGWSRAGNTRQKYQHYYTDDSFDAMLVIDGLIPVNGSSNSKTKTKNLLKPRICSNCDQTNKPESKFCVKSKFVLSFDAFNEIEEEKSKAAREAEQNKQELQQMKAKSEEQDAKSQIMMANLVSMIEHLSGAKKRGEAAVELLLTTPPPELKLDEKEEKEFLFSSAETAKERFKERGGRGGNKATYSMQVKNYYNQQQ